MKYLAPILALLAPILAAFAPQIQDLVAAHPMIAVIAGAVGTLAAAFAPPPHK